MWAFVLFFVVTPKQAVEHAVELAVMWDAMAHTRRQCIIDGF